MASDDPKEPPPSPGHAPVKLGGKRRDRTFSLASFRPSPLPVVLYFQHGNRRRRARDRQPDSCGLDLLTSASEVENGDHAVRGRWLRSRFKTRFRHQLQYLTGVGMDRWKTRIEVQTQFHVPWQSTRETERRLS